MSSSSIGRRLRLALRGKPLSGPLGRRLLGWFLVFSMVPLFASNTFGYWRSQEIIGDLVERYLDALAEVQAKHIRSQVERYLLDLDAIAAGNEFLTAGALRLSGGEAGPMGVVADKGAVERHLRRKLEELRAFDVLYLQRPDGAILASTGPLPDEALAPGVARTASGTFTGLAQIEAGGSPLFRLTAVVRGEEDVIVGYLRALIGREGLEDFLEIPPHLAGSVESYIVDDRGRPLFVSHAHHPVDYSAPLVSPVLTNGEGGFARYRDRNGEDVIGTSAQVEDLPWRYLAEAPVSAALGPLRDLRRASILVEMAFAVLLILLALLVAGSIVEPIGRLVRATRRIARGDLETRVEIRERNEIGELGAALNEMTAELAEKSSSVEKLHRREMERASKLATVGELASGVAHEIKNPLVGISNGMDLVKRRVGGDPALEPIIEEVERQLTRIEAALRDLLAFARPSEPTLAPTDLGRVVERAVLLTQPAAEREGVETKVELEPTLPPVEVDEELLRQALVNLLMNAVQATPRGGSVRVTTRRSGQGVELAVSDTGKGITPRDREDIFKPFFTTRHAGTGLGLSITREIVERHGGRLEVDSTLGEGSTFRIRLPLNGSSERKGVEEATPVGATEGGGGSRS